MQGTPVLFIIQYSRSKGLVCLDVLLLLSFTVCSVLMIAGQ